MIPSLNYAVLTDALHALKDGNIRHCKTLEFTFDEMNALNQLSLDELFIISRESAQFMTVTVQHDALRMLLARSSKEVQCLAPKYFSRVRLKAWRFSGFYDPAHFSQIKE
jgi:hypothetical protein